ncbi:hypothetical protein OEA41_002080 [Lepraria neglecta]|uniref:Uncharacterized protein n=1 Tax=Lepraria neglecta TaxID=209136 RepID=A0AAD9ZB99_9LECA|nr:hypothetical protein OEA41_002080 [Lepraria neglecta]
MEPPVIRKVHAQTRIIKIACQFDGFTEVNRCESNGNSWCCAGAAGQGLGGTNCCDTNLTTSLDPYPFSTQSVGAATSALSTATLVIFTSDVTTLTSSSSSLSPTSSEAPTAQNHVTSSQISTTAPTSSASPQPASQNANSKTRIEIGVPVAVVVVLLAILAFFISQNRKQKRRLLQLQSERAENQLRHEETEPGMQEFDVTHELTQPDAPRHEMAGEAFFELSQPHAPMHELG